MADCDLGDHVCCGYFGDKLVMRPLSPECSADCDRDALMTKTGMITCWITAKKLGAQDSALTDYELPRRLINVPGRLDK
jgi:hypothetical protein